MFYDDDFVIDEDKDILEGGDEYTKKNEDSNRRSKVIKMLHKLQ